MRQNLQIYGIAVESKTADLSLTSAIGIGESAEGTDLEDAYGQICNAAGMIGGAGMTATGAAAGWVMTRGLNNDMKQVQNKINNCNEWEQHAKTALPKDVVRSKINELESERPKEVIANDDPILKSLQEKANLIMEIPKSNQKKDKRPKRLRESTAQQQPKKRKRSNKSERRQKIWKKTNAGLRTRSRPQPKSGI